MLARQARSNALFSAERMSPASVRRLFRVRAADCLAFLQDGADSNAQPELARIRDIPEELIDTPFATIARAAT
ncbi:hypothetical protein ACFQOZ_03425 [Comamonas endophytica]|uniref:hypothetical protein n=1 Tax=Comamonas endophytica TaxID=2949090 RepID=UPI003616135E